MKYGTDYTVANRQIIFTTAPVGMLYVYRETPTDRMVQFMEGSVLKASDMNLSTLQQLHIIEEGQDWTRESSILLDEEDNTWEARNAPIKNVGDPVNAQDVVTKHYMETVQDGFVQENTKLKDAATKQANIATQQAKLATQKATTATQQANRAQAWAESKTSPDDTNDTDSPTGDTMSAKEWALYAKQIATNIGNPVASISATRGEFTVKQLDNSSKILKVEQFAQEEIPENADLNNYLTSGMYLCMYTATVSTVKNKPENSGAFYLNVIRGKLTTQRIQLLYNLSSNTLWTRSNITGTQWTDWNKVVKTSDLQSYLPLSAGSSNRLTGDIYCNPQVNIYQNLASSAAAGKQVGICINEPATSKNIRFVGFSSENGSYTAACMGVGDDVYARGFRVTADKIQFLQKDILYVAEDWSSGKQWYRRWSDGWIEQGGVSVVDGNTITLHKPMANTNYTVMATDVGDARRAYGAVSLSTTQITVYGANGYGCTWFACGRGANS